MPDEGNRRRTRWLYGDTMDVTNWIVSSNRDGMALKEIDRFVFAIPIAFNFVLIYMYLSPV